MEEQKVNAFEYMLALTYDHLEQKEKVVAENEITLLKAIKLNFFIAASSANQDNEGLLAIFSDFYAMPYGHVESTIYNRIRDLNFFVLTPNSCTLKSLDTIQKVLSALEYALGDLAISIKTAFDSYVKIAGETLKWSATQLVNLSHEWMSWQVMYKAAEIRNKRSMRIPISLIQNERKFYKTSWL